MNIKLIKEEDCKKKWLHKETVRTEKQIEAFKNLGERNKKRAIDNRIDDKVLDIKTYNSIELIKEEDCTTRQKNLIEKMTPREKGWANKFKKNKIKICPKENY